MTIVNRNAAVNAVGKRQPIEYLPGQQEYNRQQHALLRHQSGLGNDMTPEEVDATAELLGNIAPNLKGVEYARVMPSRVNGESDQRGFAQDIDSDIFPHPETSAAGKALLNIGSPLSDVEYFNRRMMNDTGRGRINPFMPSGNADFDGNELERYDITDNADGSNYNFRPPKPPTKIPGFPMDELVNLPRFIMEDCAPFAFVNEAAYKPKSLHIPYPKMLFELGPPDARHLVVVTQRGTHGFDFSTEYLHQDKETPFEVGAMSHVDLSHGDILEINQMVYQTDPAVAEWTLMAIIGFIAEYGIGNTIIGTQARDPNRVIPPPGTTRKYRIVRVVMGVTKICKPWQGGTHASPREHERIGHWRRVKGEPRWFPAVTVNKGVIGRVMKEYHVSKRNKTPRPVTQGPEA